MIEYEFYNPTKHLEQIVELEKELWKGKTSEEIYEIFAWKYPFDSNLINGFIALDGNRIVGFRGFFIQDYINNGRIFPIAVLGDAVVHPDYQRRGIFSRLTIKAIDYYTTSPVNYILALSSNSKSATGNIKMGWESFLRKEYRIGISTSNMCLGFLKHKSIARLNDFEIEVIQRTEIDRWAHELDMFCKPLDGCGCVSLRRDCHYWTWRFANPDWKACLAVLRKNGQINGVIAFLPEKRKGIKTIRILDVVVADPSLFPLFYKGLKKITDAWCYFILDAAGISNEILKKEFPFNKCSRTNSPADFYMIKSLNNSSTSEITKNIVLNYSNID